MIFVYYSFKNYYICPIRNEVLTKKMDFNLTKIYKEKQKSGEILFAYIGCISGDLISKTLEDVEIKLTEKNEDPKLIKKIYNVFVEALQNLFHHLDVPEDFEIDGVKEKNYVIFVFSKINNFAYKLTTGNFIKNEKKHLLRDRIEQINFLTKDELKELYKQVLNNDQFSKKGGGGLGMIDIVRKTGNKLEYNFVNYNNNYSFFGLDIIVT